MQRRIGRRWHAIVYATQIIQNTESVNYSPCLILPVPVAPAAQRPVRWTRCRWHQTPAAKKRKEDGASATTSCYRSYKLIKPNNSFLIGSYIIKSNALNSSAKMPRTYWQLQCKKTRSWQKNGRQGWIQLEQTRCAGTLVMNGA